MPTYFSPRPSPLPASETAALPPGPPLSAAAAPSLLRHQEPVPEILDELRHEDLEIERVVVDDHLLDALLLARRAQP